MLPDRKLPMANSWLQLALWGTACLPFVHSTFVTPNLPLSFLFQWGDPTAPFPVPVTEQCETLHISWSRSAQIGPNPTAPYYLQVYTSNFIQPFIIPAGSGYTFDWTVPFAPGTLYQICMFDKFGNTGGCQDKYTVIPSSSTLSPTCTNVTFVPQLNVLAEVQNGPMSQYGFVDECTDISLTPQNGNPPFTLTVAPSLHPPFNITSFDMKPINWTVSLSWASPFFISLADSSGALWSNGPMHAGSGVSSACLAGNVTASRDVRVPVAVGASFATLILGACLAGVGIYILSRRRSHKFQKLREPTSRWTEKQPALPQDSADTPQVYPFRMSVVGFEESRQQILTSKLQIPEPTRARNARAEIIERPPSYPQEYSPSESDYLTRATGTSSSLSPLSSTSRNALTEKSLSSLQGERHYDPLGPLRLSRSRRLGSIG